MAEHTDYPKTRLFVEHLLAKGRSVMLDEGTAHYLRDVLRMKERDHVALFNGTDGEWLGVINNVAKRSAELECVSLLRAQHGAPDAWLLAAPLKGSKHEDVAVKATELGIAVFVPVLTQFSVADKVNETRMKKLMQEAAEQSERMDVPEIRKTEKLATLLSAWPVGRTLFYADESGGGVNAADLPAAKISSWAILIGPEGGFSRDELQLLKSLKFAQSISLGPRILKADTAAITALSCLMQKYGDWNNKPAFRAIG